MIAPKDIPDNYYDRARPDVYRRIGAEMSMAHRVLDIGCGSCDLVAFMRRRYRQRVTGIDVSDGNMPRKDNPVESRAPMRCIKGNAANLDFLNDGSFDGVVTTWALHEMDDRANAIEEAFRLLRPGGKMLVVDFPKGSLAQRLWDEDYLTPKEVAELLSDAGFEKVKSRTIKKRQVIWAVGVRPPEDA